VQIIPVLQYSNTPILHPKEDIMDIKVLGPGCAKCQQTEKNVKEAVAEAAADAKVEKVTNLLEIAKYGVFGTPAVVVDGQVKSVGKIPTKDEIKKWIAKQ
jgi:small redox-active disulfide protein 2